MDRLTCAAPTRRAATLAGSRFAPPRHVKKRQDTRRSAGCRGLALPSLLLLKERPSVSDLGARAGSRSQKSLYLNEKHPWARQVSGHGFSRAAKLAKQLLPCAAGPRAAQRSARHPHVCKWVKRTSTVPKIRSVSFADSLITAPSASEEKRQ
jgi:hypothetical protein